MSTTFAHSRTSSSTSTSSTASTASTSPTSSTYRLFPRVPKSSRRHRHSTSFITLQDEASPPSSRYLPRGYQHVSSSGDMINDHDEEEDDDDDDNDNDPRSNGNETYDSAQLTASIERTTLPVIEYLHHQLRLTPLAHERERVRRQIQRQETVLTLSMLLRVWGEDGVGGGDGEDPADEDADEERKMASSVRPCNIGRRVGGRGRTSDRKQSHRYYQHDHDDDYGGYRL